ncbi:MAG: hypothetical protein DWQ47_12075 [Acidobacteria bacterium]|nr:MAG: hypothetical protein DWQ32_14490 [Acidobacteriota bacterium]REJ98308.1 MAG: hypothetical protein DWQ38_17290 [Acidobacteriota bacterium]REK17052.1 MAG: hypothetical protein DWQ43_02335 [Acidobacteriota bacterium]REK42962.1 MAG: hypothetical protein DWQ47_12075 [Acidobacteriota bacterium]
MMEEIRLPSGHIIERSVQKEQIHMKKLIQTRRDFLGTAALGAALVPLVSACQFDTVAESAPKDKLDILRANGVQDPDCEWCGARDVPDDVRWKARLHKDGDAGERLLVEGTVYKEDGLTPAPDILIYFYHTDTEGLYGRRDQHRHGRYRGWVLTDKNGKYGFYTIKPEPYPSRNNPSHVHMTVTGLKRKEDWADSILFEGDPLLNDRDYSAKKGGFKNVIELKKDAEGILRGTRNLRLWPV